MSSDTLSTVETALADAPLDSAIAKAKRRLVWFVVLLYCVAVLDRVNVGFAALTMNKAVGLSAAAFGFGASLFVAGNFIFEIPSNIMLGRVGARRWLARIGVTWGLLTMIMSIIPGERSFYVVRFLVGAAEAGAFPGIMLFLSSWFPKAHRAHLNALFLLSIPITNAVSAPLAATLMSLDGWMHLAGWQWLFVIEGLGSILVGAATFLFLTDRPADAAWLSEKERNALQDALAEEHRDSETQQTSTIRGALLSVPVILLGLTYSGINLSMVTAAFWMPQIVKAAGLPTTQVGYAVALAFALGAVAMVFWGRRSDRTRERFYHTIIPALVGVAGWCLAAVAKDPVLLIAALSLATIGHFSSGAVLWAIPSQYLSGIGAAAGFATVTTIAHVVSALGLSAIGIVKDSTGGFQDALLLVGVCFLITPIGMIALQLWHKKGKS
jgi:ACS family tartrate transporter-like MFS transporter